MEAARPDLSAHLVHLSRRYRGSDARENLLSILTSKCIEARTAYGIAVRHLEQIGCGSVDFTECQRVACFSETPLEYLEWLVNPGVWRKYNFQSYGLAFTRKYMLDKGANHVWYLNSYMGYGFPWRAHNVNTLIDEAALDENGDPDPDRFNSSDIARLTPLIEVMGAWTTAYGTQKRKDFTFEREWRHVGDFNFLLRQITSLIVPVGQVDDFREAMKEEGVNPTWSDRVEVRELAGVLEGG